MDRGVVVGAALLRAGRVLAARRTAPPAAAGRWELPGGKVEPGEGHAAALVRELAEELGCTVRVEHWLEGSTRVGEHLDLVVAVVTLEAGEPRPGEHDRLRWLGADELDDVDWLPGDRPFLAQVAAHLRAGTGARRGVLHEADDARAVAERLEALGHAVRVSRERLAGEDDDEDHPWAVETDAPAAVLEPLLDEHEGWLDEPSASQPPVGPPPPPLPRAPRRLKREGRTGPH